MKKINLAITGCLGRMGRQIIKSARKDKNFQIVSLTENKKTNKRVHKIDIFQNTENAFKNANVIINFTIPKSIKMLIIFLKDTQYVSIKQLKVINTVSAPHLLISKDTTLQLNSRA